MSKLPASAFACLFLGGLSWSTHAFGFDDRSVRQSILGGSASDHENVVYLRAGLGLAGVEPRACTGTLVARNLVLTARHCVSYFTEGDFFCTIQGDVDKARPRKPDSAGEVGLPYAAERIQFFLPPSPAASSENPDLVAVRVFAPETNTICRNDIALVEVEVPEEARARGVDLRDIKPATLRITEGVQPGELMHLVGYGTNDAGIDRQEELRASPILAVGPSEYFSVEGLALPRTFVLGRGPCPGDSGGPAFSEETGALLGVYSLFRGSCESKEARNFYTQVAPFHAFIEGVFEKVGQKVMAEDGSAGAPSFGTGGLEATDGTGGSSAFGGEGGKTVASSSRSGCSLSPASGRLYAWPVFVIILGTIGLGRKRGRTHVERS